MGERAIVLVLLLAEVENVNFHRGKTMNVEWTELGQINKRWTAVSLFW